MPSPEEVVLDCHARPCYGNSKLFCGGYGNLQSYLSTTRLRKLIVVFEYCEAKEAVVFEYYEAKETYSRI
jgi:hypothetical protein